MGRPFLFICRPVNLSTCLQGLTGQEVNIISRHYGYSVLVHLSICLPGFTGKEVNIGVQSIMGISHLSTCRPINLSTRVDRSRGNIGVQGIMGNPYLFTCRPVNLTCLPGLTGPVANIGEQGIMGNHYLFTCRPVYQG